MRRTAFALLVTGLTSLILSLLGETMALRAERDFWQARTFELLRVLPQRVWTLELEQEAPADLFDEQETIDKSA